MKTPSSTIETRQLPADALSFTLGTCEFAQAQSGEPVPVTIKARDGGPIDHWAWGRVVHDLAGMQLHKDRLPLDYCHCWDEVIGYLDQFDTSGGDLVAKGALVSTSPEDRAAEVVAKARAGVPYEASIFFDGPLVLEEVPPGEEVEVNGRRLAGPLTVIRKWSLRAVAVCPYGADRNTKTELKNQPTFSVTIERKTPMTQKPQPDADTKAELRRYREAFGEKGVEWFLADVPFEEAQQRHLDSLKDELAEKTKALEAARAELSEKAAALEAAQAELSQKAAALEAARADLSEAQQRADELQARLDAIPRGEQQPVEFSEPGESAEADERLSSTLGPSLARFAAAIRLPGSRN